MQNKNRQIAMKIASLIESKILVTDLESVVDSLINAADTVQTAHWNLKSPNFVSLHGWFGNTYNALFMLADEVAEQIKIIDIDNKVSVKRQSSSVETDEQTILKDIKNSLDEVLVKLDKAAKNKSFDRTTQNLIDGWIAAVSKMKWFVESSISESTDFIQAGQTKKRFKSPLVGKSSGLNLTPKKPEEEPEKEEPEPESTDPKAVAVRQALSRFSDYLKKPTATTEIKVSDKNKFKNDR